MRVLVVLKMLQGALLLGVGAFFLRLYNPDADWRAMRWLANREIDSDTLLIRRLLGFALQKLYSTDAHHFVLLGLAALVYALVTFTEGIGLWKRQTWAEYFTVAVSASFLPLELWEIVHRPKSGTILLMLFNVVVVIYLVGRLRYKNAPTKPRTK